MDLLGFGVTQVVTFILVLARVGGIFTTAPVFGNMHISPMVRVAIALSLAFVFFPMVRFDASHIELMTFVMTIIKETCIGLAMGFLASLMFAAIQMAGAIVDLQVGFGFAQVLDPMSNQQNAVIGQLLNVASTLLFLVLNGHHMMIQGLADSFTIVPIGAMAFSPSVSGNIMQIFSRMFVAAMQIGAPVVGAVFLTDVALGILARTVPQLNVFVVGLPAKLAVALISLLAIMPMAFAVMAGLFSSLHSDLITLLRLLVSG